LPYIPPFKSSEFGLFASKIKETTVGGPGRGLLGGVMRFIYYLSNGVHMGSTHFAAFLIPVVFFTWAFFMAVSPFTWFVFNLVF
jgi:hypothetical protein